MIYNYVILIQHVPLKERSNKYVFNHIEDMWPIFTNLNVKAMNQKYYPMEEKIDQKSTVIILFNINVNERENHIDWYWILGTSKKAS